MAMNEMLRQHIEANEAQGKQAGVIFLRTQQALFNAAVRTGLVDELPLKRSPAKVQRESGQFTHQGAIPLEELTPVLLSLQQTIADLYQVLPQEQESLRMLGYQTLLWDTFGRGRSEPITATYHLSSDDEKAHAKQVISGMFLEVMNNTDKLQKNHGRISIRARRNSENYILAPYEAQTLANFYGLTTGVPQDITIPAKELGVSQQQAWKTIRHGLRKLRMGPNEQQLMPALIEVRRQSDGELAYFNQPKNP